MVTSSPHIPFSTDSKRWRLKVKEGRQTWQFLPEQESNKQTQSVIEKY
jgi:hypothetical protein